MIEYVNVWNVVDWFVIVGTYIWLALSLSHELAVGHLQEDLIWAVRQEEACLQDCTGYMQAVYSDMERLTMSARWVQFATSWFPLVILFRLFKAFKAQDRLAVVTKSLAKSAVPLLHFLIVFIA